VIIDTVARALAGGDENSPADMGAFVKNCDQIRTMTGAHLAAVHHTPKANPRVMRGHGSLLGAVDTEMQINQGVLTCTNQRDMEAGWSLNVIVKSIRIGMDEDGKEVPGAYVELRRGFETPLTAQQREVLNVIKAHSNGKPFKPKQLREWLKLHCEIELSAQQVSNLLNEIQKRRLIENPEHGKWVISQFHNASEIHNEES
jgi:AAA domain